jgi:hypothetical protein
MLLLVASAANVAIGLPSTKSVGVTNHYITKVVYPYGLPQMHNVHCLNSDSDTVAFTEAKHVMFQLVLFVVVVPEIFSGVVSILSRCCSLLYPHRSASNVGVPFDAVVHPPCC